MASMFKNVNVVYHYVTDWAGGKSFGAICWSGLSLMKAMKPAGWNGAWTT
jgi:hypothetical protein